MPPSALLRAGDRALMIVGSHTDGRLFTLESQLGQTLVLVLADGITPQQQAVWADHVTRAADRFQAVGAEAVVLLSMGLAALTSHLNPPTPGVVIGRRKVPSAAVFVRANDPYSNCSIVIWLAAE